MDIEKVVEELNECLELLDCIGTQNECKKHVLNVISMLKEHEPIKPIDIERMGDFATGLCPRCGNWINKYDHAKACGRCGQGVKWE